MTISSNLVPSLSGHQPQQFKISDLVNLTVAARHALPALAAADIVAVSASIQRVEAIIEVARRQQSGESKMDGA